MGALLAPVLSGITIDAIKQRSGDSTEAIHQSAPSIRSSLPRSHSPAHPTGVWGKLMTTAHDGDIVPVNLAAIESEEQSIFHLARYD